MVRQAERKQKQAIDNYNREVRSHNRKVKQAVNSYNREVNAYNNRVRADRQRLKNEMTRLSRQAATTRYVTYRVSVDAVQSSYERLESSAEAGAFNEDYNEILDLSEREAANNISVMNALLGDATSDNTQDFMASPLTPILQEIAQELADRWQGALFSLNSKNPDAARHFCTSAREIITNILDIKAPDKIVLAAMPNCDLTPQQGTPTRRSKIKYFLHLRGMNVDEIGEFVERDIESVVELFKIFNEGTHGQPGAFSMEQLQAIRKRVEDSIIFLSKFFS